MVGKTLGHYELVELLGSGGMGEVYRARDHSLERDVAIKILRQDVADDAEQLARLEREAKLLASMDHPGIAAIHGLERDGDLLYLVLELISGESLAQRLARVRLSVEASLDVAVQVARALEAAHARGIVHRDLKPSNVVVGADGRAKVLDFGIAKSIREDLSASETAVATELTAAGALLGTPSYMAPELIRGETIDKRADIWAFGCLLFEMLAGRGPFSRETHAETLAAILEHEPDWARLPADAPTSLLRRCLRKDPDLRLHDIADARIEIDGRSRESVAPSPEGRESRAAIPRTVAVLIAGALAALAFLAGGYLSGEGAASAPSPRYLDLTLGLAFAPDAGTLASGRIAALSPSGTVVAFTALLDGERQLYLQRTDQDAEPMLVAGSEGVYHPFFNAEGTSVGFFTTLGELRRAPVSGGQAIRVCDLPARGYGATWGTDDRIVFAASSGLFHVPADGGEPEPLERPGFEEMGLLAWPDLLPDGETLLVTGRRDGVDSVWATNPRTGERALLVVDGSSPTYVASAGGAGRLVFVRGGTLFAARFDTDALELEGEATSTRQTVYLSDRGGASYSISLDGTLLVLPGSDSFGVGACDLGCEMVWVGRDGTTRAVDDRHASFDTLRLSPDGTRIAAFFGGEIGIYTPASDTWTTLTRGWAPVWAPEGTRIAYSRPGLRGIAWVSADGSDDEEILMEASDAGRVFPMSWSADRGALLLHEMIGGRNERRVLAFSINDRSAQPFLDQTGRFNIRSPMAHPTLGWVAYVSSRSGDDEIYVARFPGPSGEHIVSTDGGTSPLWNPDGTELFYRDGRKMVAVRLALDSGLEIRRRETLFEGDYRHEPQRARTTYDYDPVSQRFLMVRELYPPRGQTRLRFVVDWLAGLPAPASTTATIGSAFSQSASRALCG